MEISVNRLLTTQDYSGLGLSKGHDVTLEDAKRELEDPLATKWSIEEMKCALLYAWFQKDLPASRSQSKLALMAAPLFHPFSDSTTLLSRFSDYATKKSLKTSPLEDYIYKDALPPESSASKSKTPIVYAMETVAAKLAGEQPFQEDASTILLLFSFAAIRLWRGLTKKTTETSPWVNNAAGVYKTTQYAIESVLSDRTKEAFLDVIRWYSVIPSTDLLSTKLLPTMIYCLARVTQIPPFIMASIKSVWMYHGLGPYVFLQNAAIALSTPPCKILAAMCCSIVNNTIVALIRYMQYEITNDIPPELPYMKILSQNFLEDLSSRRSVNFMYLIRQIICPADPNNLPTTGMWAKLIDKPPMDIARTLYEASKKIRKLFICQTNPEITSAIMIDVFNKSEGAEQNAPEPIVEEEPNNEWVDPDELPRV